MGIFNNYTFGNAIYTAIQNSRTKKDIRRIVQQVSDANYANRAVTAMPYVNNAQLLLTSGDDNDVYRYDTQSQTPALDYIWGVNKDPESMVVSGGTPDARVRALMPFVRKAQLEGTPVVALYSGNSDLDDMIHNNCVMCEDIGYGKMYYDVFRGIPVEDIANILYETMPESTNPSAESLLRAVIEVLIRLNGKITFRDLAMYSTSTLIDDLDGLSTNGSVDVDEYREISRDYMAGSTEIDAVRSFMNKLNRQMENVFGKPHQNTCNIKKTLNLKGVVAIDVGIGNNELAMNLLLNHLLYYQEAGKPFAILVDGISVSQYEQFRSLLRGRTFAISESDFIASLFGGKNRGEDLFTEMMGNVCVAVIFNHKSGTSCQKWSEQLGKYHKLKIKTSISQSNSFMMSNDSRGIQVDETDEPRVRAETISMLPGSLACIHNQHGTLFAEI